MERVIAIMTSFTAETPELTLTEISTKGRHDPCVGVRATPIAEAMLALVLMDHLLRNRGQVGSNDRPER